MVMGPIQQKVPHFRSYRLLPVWRLRVPQRYMDELANCVFHLGGETGDIRDTRIVGQEQRLGTQAGYAMNRRDQLLWIELGGRRGREDERAAARIACAVRQAERVTGKDVAVILVEDSLVMQRMARGVQELDLSAAPI